MFKKVKIKLKIINFLKLMYDFSLFFILGPVSYARKKGVLIGNNCRIYIKNWGSEPFLITIGDNVTITSGVRFVTHDGSTCLVRDEEGIRFNYFASISVGSNVFIGINSIILPGVNIGNNVVIGAGSIVTKDIPSNTVVAGSPARPVKSFSSFQESVKQKGITEKNLKSLDDDYRKRVLKFINRSSNEK